MSTATCPGLSVWLAMNVPISRPLHEKGTLELESTQAWGPSAHVLEPVLMESLVFLRTLKGEMEKEAGLGVLRSKRKSIFIPTPRISHT